MLVMTVSEQAFLSFCGCRRACAKRPWPWCRTSSPSWTQRRRSPSPRKRFATASAWPSSSCPPRPHDHAPRPASGGACALRLPRSAIHSCRGVQGAAAAGASVVGPVPSFSANRKCVTLHSGSAGSPSRWRRCSGARAIVFGYPEVHYTPLGECREPQPLAPV